MSIFGVRYGQVVRYVIARSLSRAVTLSTAVFGQEPDGAWCAEPAGTLVVEPGLLAEQGVQQ